MKYRLSALILGFFILSACTPVPTLVPAVTEASLESYTAREEVTTATDTLSPTLAATATPSPTPIPIPPIWQWVYDPESTDILAVNLSGETRVIGTLDLEAARNYLAIPIQDELALLLVASDVTLRAYLLSIESLQPIRMPDSFPYNGVISPTSLAGMGIYEQYIVFTYATRESVGGHGGNDMPRNGPAFYVDTANLTARLIDSAVMYDAWTDTRRWFHLSNDGQFLRYLNGDPSDMKVRQVDLLTGETRTIASTTKSPFSIYGSPSGDLWSLRYSGLIVDLDGNRADFNDTGLRFKPLEGGKGISMPVECSAPCTLQVMTPFGSDPVLNYSLPWSISGGAYFPLLSQLLPDESLLFVGNSDSLVGNPTGTLEMYPGLLADDEPVFRLSPDGEARLVGAYRQYDFNSSGRMPISEDGRYILLKAQDQSEFFVYDVLADKALFSLPFEPGLEYFYSTLQFHEKGILLHLSAATLDDQYQYYYSLYLFDGGRAVAWEDTAGVFLSCPDLYNDGSLACWVYTESGSDLVRYDPVSGTQTTLLESVWVLEYLP